MAHQPTAKQVERRDDIRDEARELLGALKAIRRGCNRLTAAEQDQRDVLGTLEGFLLAAANQLNVFIELRKGI